MNSENIVNRKSNFELLRIISMFLIVIAHCVYYVDFSAYADWSINSLIVKILRIGAKIGVNCFVLITGYFMVNSTFKIEKLIKLEIKVVAYTMGIFILNVFIGIVEINFKLLIQSMFPIIFSLYWFMTAYVLLYMFSPFLNEFIKKVKKEQLLKLIFVLVLVRIIIPTITTSELGLSNLSWFITLYLISAYLKKNITFFDNKKTNRKIFIFNLTFIILSIIVITFFSNKVPILKGHENYFSMMNKIPLVLCSISLFSIFKSIEIKNKVINNIAKNTLGVYLIHENIIIRKFIWENFLTKNISNSLLLIIYITTYCLCLFIACILIDKIINFIVEIIYKLLKKIFYKIKLNEKLESIKEKFIEV